MSAAGDAVERVQVALASPYRSGDGDPLILDLIADALAAIEAAGGGGGGEDSGWVGVALSDGWTDINEGNPAPAVRKIGQTVYIRGTLDGGAKTGDIVTTLPEGYRPAFRRELFDSDGAALLINTDGTVEMDGDATVAQLDAFTPWLVD